MARAFKCDRCREFKEGSGKTYLLNRETKVLAGEQTVARAELCEDCEDELLDEVEEHLQVV